MKGPIDQAPMSQAEFEAMMRRWLMKVGGRYAPVVAIAVTVLLILVFVPTKQPSTSTALGINTGTGNSGLSSGTATNGSGPGSSATNGQANGTQNVNTVGSNTASGSQAGTIGNSDATGPGATQPGPAGGSASTPPSTAIEVNGSSSGVSKTGVHCGNGARQFAWTSKAPLCVAAFNGNNGGATAPGVTATTITLSYRLANSAQQAAIDDLAGKANINQTDYVDDLNSYINFFNKQFELYGRHVVLKTYQGQGDYLEEDQGQDLQATTADAATVAGTLHAFGDVTFSLEASQYYEQDLANDHVVGFSSVGLSQQWYQQYSPYEYSVQGGDGTDSTAAAAYVVCHRMAGLPAIFAGSTLYQHTTRKFGIIYPQTPVYTSEVNEWRSTMTKECGVNIPSSATIGYAINVAQYETEALTAMEKLQSQGVTTVLCACDPIVLIFLTDAASSHSGINYYPEWFGSDFGDPIGRNYDQTEWSHAIVGGLQFPSVTSIEAYRTFALAYPGRRPAEWSPSSPPYFYVPYYTLLQVFDALQAAGPDLNPTTFQEGMFGLPASTGNDIVGGFWQFGRQVYDPVHSFGLAWWNPNYVSKFDDTKGGYEWCNGGQTYIGTAPANIGGPGVQLQCFGR